MRLRQLQAKKKEFLGHSGFSRKLDPVGTGLVTSLARPGGNITGLSIQQTDLASKRLETLRELLPGLRTLDPGRYRRLKFGPRKRRDADGSPHAQPRYGNIRGPESGGYRPAFDGLKGRAEALYVCSSPLLTTNRIRVNNLALGVRVPTMHGFREHIVAGGLMSYGPNLPSLFRRAADYVDKILRGTRSSSRPSSISLSTSPPPRYSALKFRRRCLPAPTR